MRKQKVLHFGKEKQRIEREEEQKRSIRAMADELAKGYILHWFMDSGDENVTSSYLMDLEQFESIFGHCFKEDMKHAILKWGIEIYNKEIESIGDADEYLAEEEDHYDRERKNDGTMMFILWFVPAFFYALYRVDKYEAEHNLKLFLNSITGRNPTEDELGYLCLILNTVDNNVIAAMSGFRVLYGY